MSADLLFELIKEFCSKGEITSSEMDLLKAQAKDLELSEEELKALIDDVVNEEKIQKEKIEKEQEAKRKQEETERREKEEAELKRKEEQEKKRKEIEELKRQRAEKRKAFWKKYGKAIISGSLILVTAAAVLGWNWYQDEKERQAIEQQEWEKNAPARKAYQDSLKASNERALQRLKNRGDENDPYEEIVGDEPPGKYPFTAYQEITEADLRGLSKSELRIMRNEIYARHGYVFSTTEMKSYFENQSWYRPIYNNEKVISSLSKIEKHNVELIKKHE